jgi:hypothetical protein
LFAFASNISFNLQSWKTKHAAYEGNEPAFQILYTPVKEAGTEVDKRAIELNERQYCLTKCKEELKQKS